MKRPLATLRTAALLTLLAASSALGASISITPLGNGVFTIQGTDFDQVAAFDLTITYDTASLSNPRVTNGPLLSGATAAINPNTAGTIRLGVMSTAPLAKNAKPGQIATITFGTHTGSGTVTVKPNMIIDTAGKNVPGGAQMSAYDIQTATTSPSTKTETPGGTGTGDTGKGGSQGGGQGSGDTGKGGGTTTIVTPTTGNVTITMPTETTASGETKPAAPAPAAPEAAPQATPTEPKGVEPPPAVEHPAVETPAAASTAFTSVLERFRTYRGEASPAKLTELFAKPVATTIAQSPAIVVSDGMAKVSLSVKLPASSTSPNFALTGARMISFRGGETKGSWLLEVLPNAKTTKASVTILSGSSVIEYPLTVVPPLATAPASEADLAAFLKDNGAKPPRYDLNGDGRHDYVDDYIVIAHYLLRKKL